MFRRGFLQSLSFVPFCGIAFGVQKNFCVKKETDIEGADTLWGTYGKSGKDPIKYVKLCDCETDHLQNILKTQNHLYVNTPDANYILNAIREILKFRKAFIPTLMMLLCMVMAGCVEEDDPSIAVKNRETLSGQGKEIGILPDGRKVSQYYISRGDLKEGHFLYVVDGSITLNRDVSDGENTINHVEVLIDGQKFKLIPEENR